MLVSTNFSPTNQPFTICFTICLFISPDLDGHRAPKMKYCQPTNQCQRKPVSSLLVPSMFCASRPSEKTQNLIRHTLDMRRTHALRAAALVLALCAAAVAAGDKHGQRREGDDHDGDGDGDHASHEVRCPLSPPRRKILGRCRCREPERLARGCRPANDRPCRGYDPGSAARHPELARSPLLANVHGQAVADLLASFSLASAGRGAV